MRACHHYLTSHEAAKPDLTSSVQKGHYCNSSPPPHTRRRTCCATDTRTSWSKQDCAGWLCVAAVTARGAKLRQQRGRGSQPVLPPPPPVYVHSWNSVAKGENRGAGPPPLTPLHEWTNAQAGILCQLFKFKLKFVCQSVHPPSHAWSVVHYSTKPGQISRGRRAQRKPFLRCRRVSA